MTDAMAPVHAFYRVYNEGDFALWDATVAEDYSAEINGNPIPNREVGLGFVKMFRDAFPDLLYTVDQAVVAGNHVTTRWTARGTHRGAFLGHAATGKSVAMVGITLFELNGGKIRKLWNVWDVAGLVKQLAG
jgi:steroid delta-isomerase-like uncharacterized protein